jgi:Uncharacterized conserved protein containing a coiled-coil domain
MSLKAELLRLLREDEEFRLAVMGLLGYVDIKSSVDKLVEAVKEQTRQIEELAKIVKTHEERLAKLEERLERLEDRLSRVEAALEKLTKIVESHEERLAKLEERLAGVEERLERLEKTVEELARAVRSHDERLAAFDRKLTALGARWGVESEDAFRNAMKGVVEDILGVAAVSRWAYFDREGVVYGYPSQIEVDVVIKNGVHILVEVKASVSSGDVLELSKIGKLYELVTGVKPRLLLVTPFIDEKGLKRARELGIEVYTSV